MRLLLAFGAMLFAAAPAAAHDIYDWHHEQVRLTAAQAGRVAALVRQASAEPAGEGQAFGLARIAALTGDCEAAERLMRGISAPAPALHSSLFRTASSPDRACADRAIGLIAAAARVPGTNGPDAATLYQAAMLWRRIGAEAKAGMALAEVEGLFDSREAAQGDRVWSCHGGDCISDRWSARLDGLRVLHGTPRWREELQRLAELAAPALRSDLARDSRDYVGQAVFERLVNEAAVHGEEAIGLRLVPATAYSDARAYYAARMHALLADGRTAEAMALLPRAGAAFEGADPQLIAEHFAAFAAVPGFADSFRYRFDRRSLTIIRALMRRGDFQSASALIAAARSGAANGASRPVGYAEMEGLAAWLDDPRAPVARLASRSAGGSVDAELSELALFLATRGDWTGFEAGLAAVRDRRVRARVLAQLPCRLAPNGEAATLQGISRAGTIRPAGGSGEDRSNLRDYAYQSYVCLLRHGHGDAALAYVDAVRPLRMRYEFASGLPIWARLADADRVRRRLADLALGYAERFQLWGADDVPSLTAVATDYERLGDYGRADRIVRRFGRAERFRMILSLIESYYQPAPIDWGATSPDARG